MSHQNNPQNDFKTIPKGKCVVRCLMSCHRKLRKLIFTSLMLYLALGLKIIHHQSPRNSCFVFISLFWCDQGSFCFLFLTFQTSQLCSFKSLEAELLGVENVLLCFSFTYAWGRDGKGGRVRRQAEREKILKHEVRQQEIRMKKRKGRQRDLDWYKRTARVDSMPPVPLGWQSVCVVSMRKPE